MSMTHSRTGPPLVGWKPTRRTYMQMKVVGGQRQGPTSYKPFPHQIQKTILHKEQYADVLSWLDDFHKIA
jgi:hypothetical protein